MMFERSARNMPSSPFLKIKIQDRKIALTVFFTLIMIFIMVLFLEIIFRLTSQFNISGIIYDEVLGWRYKKNLVYKTTYSPGTTYLIHINSKGFHDGEYSFLKPKNTQRIVFLGDSYTAALHVPEEQTFCRIFEKMANAEKGNKYEIMNFAVSAWATDQQLLYMKMEGMRCRPDYLFLMIAPNDITESYAKKFFYINENNVLKRSSKITLPWFVRLGWFFSNRSCFFQLLQQKIFKTDFGNFSNIFHFIPVGLNSESFPSWDYPLYLKDPPKEIIEAKKLFKALILEINRLCLVNNCRLILVILPPKMAFDGQLKDKIFDPRSAAKCVKHISEEQNILFLDLHSLLEKEKMPLEIFLPQEYHYDKRGNIFVAEKLYNFFLSLRN